jgi:DNA-binding XRE family transcriptional regulator
VCEKICCKLGKKFTDTFQLLNLAYGGGGGWLYEPNAVLEWFKRSKEGRMSVGEDPSSGRTSASTNDDHVERVRAVVRGNRRLTVREAADEVGISTESCHKVFTGKRQMCRVGAKFVPRLLSDDRKESRVEIN